MTEPEEIIEARFAALIAAAVPGVAVVGLLTPSEPGTEKTAPDTCISIAADVDEQSFDSRVANVPYRFTVRITVRVAIADDASGILFRDTCRAVYGAIHGILGDGCSAVSADGFTCDGVTRDPTATNIDTSANNENSAWTKTYPLAVTGRYSEPPSAEEDTTTPS